MPVDDERLRTATTLPATAYHDPAVYERERHAVFATEWQLAGFRVHLARPGDSHRVVHDIAANWKTYTDNYSEGYHIPLVHPGLNREVVAKQYRVDVHDHYCVHSAPAREGAVYAGKWLWRYPNLALNLYPDGMTVERFVPTGPRSTRIVYDYFFDDVSPAAADANAAKVRASADVVDEDRRICEAVQRNLEAGVYDAGRLSPRHEGGVYAFQQWVRDSLARHP